MTSTILKYAAISPLAVLFLLTGCAKPTPRPADSADFETLLSRMTNLTTFAERPLGDSFLESSYDRTGGNRDWAVWTKAEPSGRITLLDLNGPGYISRIWTAGLDAKRWLFFFDGEQEPRIAVGMNELFGDAFPFVPPLAGRAGGGRYCRLPIPFSRGIRIEIEPGDLKESNRNYYHINYTRLDMKAEAVASYPKSFTAAQSNAVSSAIRALSSIGSEQEKMVETAMAETISQSLKAGESLPFWEDSDSGLLESFFLRIDEPDNAAVMNADLLRHLRLQLFWDGSREPAADIPLGDFFGNPFYNRSFSALPLGRVNDVFVCRFPMPYTRGARALVKNASSHDVRISAAACGRRDGNKGLTRRFHAVWRATNRSGEPFRMMETEGAGHYIGCFLTSIGQDGSWNILEGDETLSPDPGTQPQQIGTGLEDYFDGAYYYTSLFDLPFSGLIEKGAMRTDQYRLHMLDAVDFRHSFAAEIEFGHGNHAQGYMSSVVYWYADRNRPVPLDHGQTALLARPHDRFELHGLMSQFFLLERAALYADAADRIRFFAARYADRPWTDLLRVRALGYRELVAGFAAVKQEYQQAATLSSFAPAAQAAKDRLWLAQSENHALLGIHALCKYKLYLNNKEVASGEGQGGLRVHRVEIRDGQYEWTAELEPTRQGSFFSLCLRTRTGDITSAGKWITVATDGAMEPQPSFEGNMALPNMTVWAFEPNAYVGMQSPAMAVNLWSFWAPRARVSRAVLKKKWDFKTAARTAPSTAAERERSPEELRMHAVDPD